MQSGPIWAVKIAILFHLLFYNKELKLLAHLCVNVILVSTPAKHCITSDSYCFKIEFSKGDSPPPPLKETLMIYAHTL